MNLVSSSTKQRLNVQVAWAGADLGPFHKVKILKRPFARTEQFATTIFAERIFAMTNFQRGHFAMERKCKENREYFKPLGGKIFQRYPKEG